VPNNNVGNTTNPNRGEIQSFGRFDGTYPGRVIQYRAKVIF